MSFFEKLKTNNGNFGGSLQKKKVLIDHYNCECGAFETILYNMSSNSGKKPRVKDAALRKASPDLQLTELLNTREGLQAIAESLPEGQGLIAKAQRQNSKRNG